MNILVKFNNEWPWPISGTQEEKNITVHILSRGYCTAHACILDITDFIQLDFWCEFLVFFICILISCCYSCWLLPFLALASYIVKTECLTGFLWGLSCKWLVCLHLCDSDCHKCLICQQRWRSKLTCSVTGHYNLIVLCWYLVWPAVTPPTRVGTLARRGYVLQPKYQPRQDLPWNPSINLGKTCLAAQVSTSARLVLHPKYQSWQDLSCNLSINLGKTCLAT